MKINCKGSGPKNRKFKDIYQEGGLESKHSFFWKPGSFRWANNETELSLHA